MIPVAQQGGAGAWNGKDAAESALLGLLPIIRFKLAQSCDAAVKVYATSVILP